MIKWLLVFPVLTALASSPARAVDLDAFAPATCADLDRQLAPGGEAVATFNATSHGAVDALRAGRPAEGCPALRQVLRFITRATDKLTGCTDADPNDSKLLAGFRDLQRQIERIGNREGCLRAPSS